MVDTISPEMRSEVMRRIKGADTSPELKVRSLLHRMGYRFRLRRSDLPGKPDIVLPRHRAVVFVHGCFWHRHNCANGRRLPKSRREYWEPKLNGNRGRDLRQIAELERLGWRVLVLWECEIQNEAATRRKIEAFFRTEDKGYAIEEPKRFAHRMAEALASYDLALPIGDEDWNGGAEMEEDEA